MATALVTTLGRSSIVKRLLNTYSTPSAIPKYIAWGTGAGETDPSDQGLFVEVISDGRANGTAIATTTTTTGDTYQVIGTLTAGTNETITNVGLFDSASTPYQTTLASPVTSATQTLITVATSGNIGTIPATQFNIQVSTEVMTVTGVSGANWSVTRAANNPLASIAASTVVQSVSGNLFAKANFGNLPLTSGDSIYFIINVQFQ